MTPEFLITALVVIASPGAGALYTIAAGLHGRRASLAAAFGCTLGIVPHVAAAITGLAALLHASALAFEALRFAGVAYLLYMGWKTLQADGPLRIEAAGDRSAVGIIRVAILTNLLNPKLSVFFLAFLPQFVPADAAAPTQLMLALSGVFMLLTFVVFAGYGLAAAATARHILRRQRVLAGIRRGFALAFVVMGARLALAER